MTASFKDRYGKVAVVAGASEGLGAAFAHALAARGLDLFLIARRADALGALSKELESQYGVQVHSLAADLADPSCIDSVAAETAGLLVGLAVYNAGASFTGRLLDRPLGDALQVVRVNIEGPLRFVHALAPPMQARKRGGLVLMSSVAGFQGAPTLAPYASSKAFNIVLGESLWAELRGDGIDVITSCAGAIRTPNYSKATKEEAPGILDARVVAERTLDALGHGPIVVPGGTNKLARFFLGRLLSRRRAVRIMENAIAKASRSPG